MKRNKKKPLLKILIILLLIIIAILSAMYINHRIRTNHDDKIIKPISSRYGIYKRFIWRKKIVDTRQ